MTDWSGTDKSVEPGYAPFYVVRAVDGATQRLGDVSGMCGGWLADGRIVYAKGRDIFSVNRDGSNVHKFVSSTSEVYWPRSSPDGKRIRFSINAIPRLWESDADGKDVHPLFAGTDLAPSGCCGAWTPSGRYIVFSTRDDKNLWVRREPEDFFHKASLDPVELAAYPLILGSPISSRDGKRIFARGRLRRGEVRRFDLKAQKAVPYLGGISAWWLDFPRDGQRVTYLSYPDDTLWASKLDGRERVQLTFPPMEPSAPHWSPDGKQIVFSGHSVGGKDWNIYLVAAEGGRPEVLVPTGPGESMPDWVPDGKRLVFGAHQGTLSADLRIVDIMSKQISIIPGSQGLEGPRWSPDGRFIVARDPKFEALQLFDFKKQTWSRLVSQQAARPAWSRDSNTVFFMSTLPNDPAILRVRLSDRKIDSVMSLIGFHLASGREGEPSFSIALDDSVILPLEVGPIEIYALDWEAP